MATSFFGLGPGGFSKVSGTTLALPFPTAIIPADRTLLMWVLMDNLTASTPVVSSISSPGGGQTWVKRTEVNSPIATAAAGVRAELWELRVTQDIPISYAATLTFSGAIVAKAAQIGIFSTLGPWAGATVYPGTWPQNSGGGGAFSAQLIATENNVPPVIQSGLSHIYTGPSTNAFSFGSTGSGAAANVYASVAYFLMGTGNTGTTWTTTDAGGFMGVWGGITEPVLVQAAYRLYAEGTETGSVALAAQDTAPTIDASSGDVPFQLRVRVQENGTAPVPLSSDFAIQFEKNGSGVWTVPQGGSTLLSTYPESNEQTGTGSSLYNNQSVGVQVVGDGRPLTRVGFRVAWFAGPPTPTGVMSAQIVGSSGPFGAAGSKMSGPALATSTNTISASLVSTGQQWFFFDFDGSFVLDAGVPYFLAISSTSIVTGGSVVMIKPSGATGVGNYSWGVIGGSTNTAAGQGVIYEAHVRSDATGVSIYDSPSLNNNALTTNRLGAGTGSFVPGDISEDGVANDFGWLTPGNYTELLYGLKLLAADLNNGDVIRFRVIRNDAVINTYTVTPTVNVFKGAATQQVSGTVAIVSTVSGDATRTLQVLAASGTISILSDSSGNPVKSPLPASGIIPIVSTAAGSVTQRQSASGLVQISSAVPAPSLTVTAAVFGVVPIVSDSAGTVTARHIASGVTPIVSTAAGDAAVITPSVSYPAAGVISIVSTASGAVSSRQLTSGVAAIVSDAAGAITARHVASGVTPIVSTAVGNVTVGGSTAGTVSIISGAAGAVTSRQGVSGIAPIVSDSSGAVTARHAVSGAVPVVSTASGAATVIGGAVTHQVSGVVSIVSTAAVGSAAAWGAPESLYPPDMLPNGPADASTFSIGNYLRVVTAGRITAIRFYSFMPGHSNRHVALWTDAGVLLAQAYGTAESTGWNTVPITPVAVTAGQVIVASYGYYGAAVSGSFAYTSVPIPDSSAGIDWVGGAYSDAGTSPESFPSNQIQPNHYFGDVLYEELVAGGAEPVTIGRATAGVVAIVSGGGGAVTASLLTAGAVPIVSTAVGTITALHSVSGSTPIISTASGAPNLRANAAGVVAIVSTAAGAVRVGLATTGTAAIVSDSAGAVTARHVASGIVPIVSTTAGTANPSGSTSGTIPIVSVATGAVTARLNVSGRVDIISDASGSVTARHVATGSIPIVSTASGAASTQAAVAGIVAITSLVAGAVTSRQQASGTVPIVSAASGVATQVHVIAAGGVGIAPEALPGCVIALEGVDVPAGPVTVWPDRSPLDNDVVPILGAPVASGSFVTATTDNVLASTGNLPMVGNAPFHLMMRIRTRQVYAAFMGWGVADQSQLIDLWNYSGGLIWHGHGGGNDTVAGAPSFAPDVWHIVQLVYDGSRIEVWVDEQPPGVATGRTLNIPANTLQLGRGRYSPGGDFDLSGLFLYDRVLTPTERDDIRDHLNGLAAPAGDRGATPVAIVSTTSGELVNAAGASGTVEIVSTVSGAVTLRAAASGVVPIVSTASGTVTSRLIVSGVADILSDSAGAVTKRLPVSGAAAIVSTSSGTVTAKHSASGVIPIVTTTSGSTVPTGSVSGVVPIVTTASGAVTARLGVSARADVVSALSGAVTAIHAVSGAVAISSTAAGEIERVNMAAAGVVPVVSAASGSVTARHQVSGTVVIVSSVSGDAAGGSQVSGTVEIRSAASGAVSLTAAVSGLVQIASSAAGAVTRTTPVSGSVAIVSSVSGLATKRSDTAGRVDAVTTVVGQVTATHQVSGTVVIVSGVIGAVTSSADLAWPECLGLTLTGPVLSLSAAAGQLQLRGFTYQLIVESEQPALALIGKGPRSILRAEESC